MIDAAIVLPGSDLHEHQPSFIMPGYGTALAASFMEHVGACCVRHSLFDAALCSSASQHVEAACEAHLLHGGM